MTTVRVYTKPNCKQCDLTKAALDQEGVSFLVDDLTDPQNLAAAKSLGFSSAPVVMVEDDGWAGFQPDRIKALAARLKEAN